MPLRTNENTWVINKFLFRFSDQRVRLEFQIKKDFSKHFGFLNDFSRALCNNFLAIHNFIFFKEISTKVIDFFKTFYNKQVRV